MFSIVWKLIILYLCESNIEFYMAVFSICVLASFVRLGAKDWNDTAVNTSTKGHCKIIPE